jgi:hypothetical protein
MPFHAHFFGTRAAQEHHSGISHRFRRRARLLKTAAEQTWGGYELATARPATLGRKERVVTTSVAHTNAEDRRRRIDPIPAEEYCDHRVDSPNKVPPGR